jgi:uncharacterized membrane protein YqjE
MHFRVLGWAGFVFLAAGLTVLIFGPKDWNSYGCAAVLTSVTLYVTGLVMVARQISRVRRQANEMLQRVADEMEKRKK